MKVAFYKGRNRSLLALSLGLFLPLCLGVALLIQAYIKSASIEIMNSWLQTEAVDIQEGNLLSSVTKHRRLLMSSALVTAVSLYDVEEIGRRSGPIIFFGERSGDSNSMDTILVPPGEIVSTSSAIFQEQIFYRFPEMPSLVLVFHVQPKLAWVVFGIIQSVAFIFLVAALSMLTWARHKEEETRIELLKYAINELITKKKPSEALSHEIPAISSAWEELRLTMDKLAQELTNQATNAAIAQTTQMLAHDTKQPFTQLKMGLELLEHCQLSDEAAETVGLIKRSVGKSLAKVSALIADIMIVQLSFCKLLDLSVHS